MDTYTSEQLKKEQQAILSSPPSPPTDDAPAEDYGGHAGHGRILNQPPNLHARPGETL